MHIVSHYPDGIFSWVDLTTTDVAGAKAFYGSLFGWNTIDLLTDVGGFYTMAQIEGHNVAGMGPLSDAMQQQGVPSHWTSYVNHSDVDTIAQKAGAAGGHIVLSPMDVMDSGRMTIIIDPTGAAFGVWQPKNHMGAQMVNSPNTLVWNELQTRDPDTAIAFYRSVFGWTSQIDKDGYMLLAQAGRGQAGIEKIGADWPENVPANWQVYFMVSDLETIAAKAKMLGGTLMSPPTPAGEMGTFIVMADPQGAVFSVMSFNNPVAPPPGA